MMISVHGQKGSFRLEDSGLEPQRVGEFLAATIRRRHLSESYVARKSGLSEANLRAIVDNEMRLDRKASKKLEKVFPRMGRMLLKLQQHREFFDMYGVPRPASPVRRAMIIRARKPKAA